MDEREEELRESFAECDLNNDGMIQLAEFSILLNNIGAETSAAECKIGFEEVDTDHNGLISLDEFIAWWTDR